MICIERHIQKIRPGKWGELEAMDKKWNTVESRLGFPAKRRYRCYIGGHKAFIRFSLKLMASKP